jgi:transcriptional regulator of met regulon
VKLRKFDFAYKYISKEFDKLKNLRGLFNSNLPDEKFVHASQIVTNLTKEISLKNELIDDLNTKLKKLKNQIDLNQTF